jgi:hypothetical protein
MTGAGPTVALLGSPVVAGALTDGGAVAVIGATPLTTGVAARDSVATLPSNRRMAGGVR